MKTPTITLAKKYAQALKKCKGKYVSSEKLSKVIGFYPDVINDFFSYFNPMVNIDYTFNLREVEDEVRRDMRGYCGQIQKAVTDSCLAVINDKLKDIEEVKKTAIDMRIMKTQLETEMKNAMEKIDAVNEFLMQETDEKISFEEEIQRLLNLF